MLLCLLLLPGFSSGMIHAGHVPRKIVSEAQAVSLNVRHPDVSKTQKFCHAAEFLFQSELLAFPPDEASRRHSLYLVPVKNRQDPSGRRH